MFVDPDVPSVPPLRGSRKALQSFFNISKKFIDILDDVWNSLRGLLPPEVIQIALPFIIGAVGFITNFGEGLLSARALYKVYKLRAQEKQYKTKLITQLLSVGLAAGGGGISFALLAGGAGASVTALTMALAPALVPGLLGLIYCLALYRKSYILAQVKKQEAVALIAAENAFATLIPYGENLKTRRTLFIAYQLLHEQRLRCEREVAFNIVEVIASATVVAGVVLCTAALVGASVASMGILPLAILITGVVLGVACKILEYLDNKKDFAYTRTLREKALNLGAKLCGKKREPKFGGYQLEPTPSSTPTPSPSPQPKRLSPTDKIYQNFADLHAGLRPLNVKAEPASPSVVEVQVLRRSTSSTDPDSSQKEPSKSQSPSP